MPGSAAVTSGLLREISTTRQTSQSPWRAESAPAKRCSNFSLTEPPLESVQVLPLPELMQVLPALQLAQVLAPLMLELESAQVLPPPELMQMSPPLQLVQVLGPLMLELELALVPASLVLGSPLELRPGKSESPCKTVDTFSTRRPKPPCRLPKSRSIPNLRRYPVGKSDRTCHQSSGSGRCIPAPWP